MFYRRFATPYRQFIVDVAACVNITKVSGVSVQVSVQKKSNNKKQIPNKTQSPKFKIPNDWLLSLFEIWILGFVIYL
jgi:hypothetical protein